MLSLPESNVNLVYFGTLLEDGRCRVEVPPLKEMAAQTGKVSLEVITEGNYFEPWSNDCEIKVSKTVKVESISSVAEVPKPMVTAVVSTPVAPVAVVSPQVVEAAPRPAPARAAAPPARPRPMMAKLRRASPSLSSQIDSILK